MIETFCSAQPTKFTVIYTIICFNITQQFFELPVIETNSCTKLLYNNICHYMTMEASPCTFLEHLREKRLIHFQLLFCSRIRDFKKLVCFNTFQAGKCFIHVICAINRHVLIVTSFMFISCVCKHFTK